MAVHGSCLGKNMFTMPPGLSRRLILTLALTAGLTGCGAEDGTVSTRSEDLSATVVRLELNAPARPKISGTFKSVAGISGGDRRVTLFQGTMANKELAEWYRRSESDAVEFRSGTITVLDQDLNSVVAQYVVSNTLPTFVAEATTGEPSLTVEKVELAVEKIELVSK